eukprot:scaffold1033_cov408-Prasinococcus_capsulatus_cf.AAC.31
MPLSSLPELAPMPAEVPGPLEMPVPIPFFEIPLTPLPSMPIPLAMPIPASTPMPTPEILPPTPVQLLPPGPPPGGPVAVCGDDCTITYLDDVDVDIFYGSEGCDCIVGTIGNDIVYGMSGSVMTMRTKSFPVWRHGRAVQRVLALCCAPGFYIWNGRRGHPDWR